MFGREQPTPVAPDIVGRCASARDCFRRTCHEVLRRAGWTTPGTRCPACGCYRIPRRLVFALGELLRPARRAMRRVRAIPEQQRRGLEYVVSTNWLFSQPVVIVISGKSSLGEISVRSLA
jgi:hypothetical protein